MSIIEQIYNAQLEQIQNPTRACVNSEHAFVREKLLKLGFYESAEVYWNFVCGNKKLINDENVISAAEKLSAIDREFTMPDWGCSGT